MLRAMTKVAAFLRRIGWQVDVYERSRGFVFGKQFETERNRKALLVDSVDPISDLRDMRDSIDNIDAAIIHMLAERFRCTRAVGKLKAQHGLPPSDPAREAEQVSRLRQLAAVNKLDPDFAEKFLAFVIREVIRHHESIPLRGAARCKTP